MNNYRINNLYMTWQAVNTSTTVAPTFRNIFMLFDTVKYLINFTETVYYMDRYQIMSAVQEYLRNNNEMKMKMHFSVNPVRHACLAVGRGREVVQEGVLGLSRGGLYPHTRCSGVWLSAAPTFRGPLHLGVPVGSWPPTR